MNGERFVGVLRRVKPLLGLVAIAVAAFASIASCERNNYQELALPEQSVTLAETESQYSSQFTVESNLTEYYVKARFSTTRGNMPYLEVLAVGENAERVTIESSTFEEDEDKPSELVARVRVDCKNGSRCISAFELFVLRELFAEGSIEGSLSIRAERMEEYEYEGDLPSSIYFAIEAGGK
jgi:hypothetical protein